MSVDGDAQREPLKPRECGSVYLSPLYSAVQLECASDVSVVALKDIAFNCSLMKCEKGRGKWFNGIPAGFRSG